MVLASVCKTTELQVFSSGLSSFLGLLPTTALPLRAQMAPNEELILLAQVPYLAHHWVPFLLKPMISISAKSQWFGTKAQELPCLGLNPST